MRSILLFLIFLPGLCFSQTSTFVQPDLINFEPGQLIVKLKDHVDAGVYYEQNGKAKSDFNLGQFLGVEDKVASTQVMFHRNSIESSLQNQKTLARQYAAQAAANPNNGFQPEPPRSMKNVFIITTSNEQEDILALVDQLNNDPNIDYAEPNYIFNIDDFEVDKVITKEDSHMLSSVSNATQPNDPLYGSQSNITTTNIDDVWSQYTTGDGSQVVAIIDTGGDYTHPDLAANTWVNQAELNGVDGFDDDGNGYIDDVQGWDFINQDNAPLDDNGHGTHVGGIIGAVGDNGIGVAGAAWDVKLMHIKVLQSTGSGNSTNFAAGVEYAASNGASIINMSLGSYGESATLKLALENAYATSFLVAAAGNSGICIGPGKCPDGRDSAPLFPGAYSFVLGVEDGVGLYDNYDQDGPTASRLSGLLNYEVKAPGSQILSTMPGGGYASLTGTSMATPLVAGGLALYLQENPSDSKEIIFGNLINTSQSNVDFLAAMDVVPTPQLSVVSTVMRDSINNQNNNELWEPAETIEILPLIKNYWGPTTDVRVGIEFAQFEDQSKATILQDEIQIGSISAYASLQDLNESLKISISNNVANNVDIKFVLRAWSGPNQEYLSDELELVVNVKNAILLSGLINTDTTLSSNYEYLVVDNVAVTGNAVLTIEPGTVLKFSDNKKMTFTGNSRFICNGTYDNRIVLTAENLGWEGIQFDSKEDDPYWHSISFTEISKIFDVWYFPIDPSTSFTISDCIITDSYILWGSLAREFTSDYVIRRVNVYEVFAKFRGSNSSRAAIPASQTNAWPGLQKLITGKDGLNYYLPRYDINYINNYTDLNSSARKEIHLNLDGGWEALPFYGWNAFSNLQGDANNANNDYYVDATLNAEEGGSLGTAFPGLYLGSSDIS
ncbi:S8 family peptidase, partial [Nonlabens sp.]|uniref:S8 family peptidase n=1 Tax=Nonlabens sp. TaxID=1888209 RepID=UPI003F69A525